MIFENVLNLESRGGRGRRIEIASRRHITLDRTITDFTGDNTPIVAGFEYFDPNTTAQNPLNLLLTSQQTRDDVQDSTLR